MRSPVLIAETPFAQGHGPRFLAAPGRGVDRQTADHYIGRVRDEEEDVEEVEGDDYLAVRMSLTEESSGETAPQVLVLAGIDANRMTSDERDEVLEQLRERLEVLNDAVAAVEWTVRGHDLVIEIPELEEWHESGWDVLPRAGRWAEDSAEASPASIREMDVDSKSDPEPESDDLSEDQQEPIRTESAPESSPEPRGDERIEDAGDPFDFSRDEKPKSESVAVVTPEPEPPAPVPEPPRLFEFPKPVLHVETQSPEPAPAQSITSPPKPIATPERLEPIPVPDLKAIKVPAPSGQTPPMRPPAPAPTEPAPTSRSIDPVQVSESVDRSPSLALLPTKPADSPRARPVALRWWVWGPWTAVAVLLTAKYLYLTQVDKTWNQRVSESHYAAGPTKVVEVQVDKPVAAAGLGNEGAWAAFVVEFRAQLSRAEVVQAAERLHAWKRQAAALEDPIRTELPELQAEFRSVAAKRLQEWTNRCCQERRFADAYGTLSAFAAADSVKALLDAAAIAEAVRNARALVRTAEDEYHYTQIRTLVEANPVPEDKLKQHIDAYLALVEPPGRMLTQVQQLVEYQKWVKEGQPRKATVTIKWGPRIAAQKHTIEFALWHRKDGVPLGRFTRPVEAKVSQEWSETFPVNGITLPDHLIRCTVKTTRPTSAVEELVDGAAEYTESFGTKPFDTEEKVESGTVVRFELQSRIERPALPAWKDSKAPVLPVSLPKVGP